MGDEVFRVRSRAVNRSEQLARSNLAYRDPALYDDMLADDLTAQTVARLTVATLGPSDQRSVLDLGCGTGRVAAELRAGYGWSATGVDVQPGMIAYARDRDPAVAWFTGDITTVRLGDAFDVVTILGNTLAYLHTDEQLTAAFRTAHLHTASTGLLLISTITGPPPPSSPASPGRGQRPITVQTRHGPASVQVSSRWNPLRRLVTTTRIWAFPDGKSVHDCYTRRAWTLGQLTASAEDAGFQPLDRDVPGITLVAIRT